MAIPMRSTTPQTDSSILLKLTLKAMAKAGISAEHGFKQAGLTLSDIVDVKERMPVAEQNTFWNALEQVTGDPHIGLHLGEFIPAYRGQTLGCLFYSSASFGEGLQLALVYQRLLTDLTAAHLVVKGQGCCLVDTTDSSISRHFVEIFVAGLIHFFKLVTDGGFHPLAIHFMHDEGAPPEDYQRIYGCPVTLGCPQRLYFNREAMGHKIWQAEPDLLQMHEMVAKEKLAKLVRPDLLADVRHAMGEELEYRTVSLDLVARKLNMPERRLRSQLLGAGTSFNQILADYRSHLARRLLAKTKKDINEIVYLTGFSNQSTFYRAFKRWTGQTPLEYRLRQQRTS